MQVRQCCFDLLGELEGVGARLLDDRHDHCGMAHVASVADTGHRRKGYVGHLAQLNWQAVAQGHDHIAELL